MKIEFVNHSSYVVDTHGIRIIFDPWIEGKAFNNGWDQISKTRFTYDDFHDVTHIWFSHEHPDHFYPANIKKIPEAFRKNITVLFQTTRDKNVVNFCRKLRFREVIELDQDQWFELAPDLQFLCYPFHTGWGDGDSWCCLKSEEFTLLNINDCQIATREDVESIRDKVGPVDLLSTQFSFSGWCGNVDQVEFRKKSALKQLSYVKLQIDVIKPRYVLPFASLVWFCHQESFYLNKEMNQITDAERMVREETEAIPIILYPGDAWSQDQEHDPAPAMAAYARDYQALDSRDREVSEPVEPARMLAASEKFFEGLRKKTNRLVTGLWLGREGYYARMYRNQTKRNRLALLFSIVCMRAEPALLWVSDHDQAYKLDFRKGLRRSTLPKEECHITLSSDSLLFCVTVPWGAETLQVNGRYQENVAEGRHSFAPFFLIARYLYFGNRFDLARIRQKITSKLVGNR